MNLSRLSLAIAFLAAGAPGLQAQQGSVAARLTARGLPTDLARQVQQIADSAAARGVPSGPLADKAVEGWAKHVSAARITAAVRQFAGRMAEAGSAVRSGGLQAPPGIVVAAAAEAMSGGIDADEIGQVVRAAGTAGAAAPGLSVAAALRAQGLDSKQAVTIVVDAMQHHRSMAQLLDLPSVARVMHDQGMSPGQIGDKLLHQGLGDDGGGGVGRGEGGDRRGGNRDRPPSVPPGMGRPDFGVVHRTIMK